MLLGICYSLAVQVVLMWQAELPTEIPRQNPFTTTADVEQGKRLFSSNCAVCHGPQGEGGRGANLARPKLLRATDDRSLFLVIRQGVPGTEMPPAWLVLNEHEMWQVTAYVRSLGRIAPEPVSGNAQQGGKIFKTSGCAGCHQVGGDGGRMGPPLTDVGARRGTAFLRAKLLEPASELPEDFLQVELVGRDGKRISGIRLNEDNYSIQVRDLSDRLLSFWKDELASVEKQRGRSPMPSYRGKLSDRELDDVVAYLVSLRTDQ